MHRIISTIFISILTLFIVVVGFTINTRTTNSINENITAAMNLKNNGDSEGAKRELQKAIDEWDHTIEIMLLFESHGKLDRIEESLKLSEMYLQNGNTNMFNEECKRASILIEHFNDLEYPTIYNIF